MANLKEWMLKVREEWQGDTVKLTFTLMKKDTKVKQWGRVVKADQAQAAVKHAIHHAKEYAQKYNETKEYEILLAEVK